MKISRPTKDPDWLMLPLIVLVVILGYGIGPMRLPLRGEETCRALHGIEMARSGDWLVATNQGVPILDRPPLQYWVLAIVHKWVHPLDPLTLRLFMVAVLLCTSLVIWWYMRAFLSAVAAFVGAVAYPTMGHVFDLGRRAETDGLFAFLLVGALMAWHCGYARHWRPSRTWMLSSAVAALAALTKGLQAPVAFFGTVYLFLLVQRDWRYVLRWSHLAGLTVFVGVIAVWQVPFYLATGWEGTYLTWLEPYFDRVRDADGTRLLAHLAKFPFAVLGATLPWSVLLVGLFHRPFWRLEQTARSAVVFILLGMATIFVPVWISEGGHHRYVMPTYPLMAVICGVVVQQCLTVSPTSAFGRFWRHYLRIMAVVTVGAVGVFVVATIASRFSDADWPRTLAQPWPLMTALVVAVIAGAPLIWRQTAPHRAQRGIFVAFSLAALLAACFNGPVLNAIASGAVSVGPEVMALRRNLPAEARLVSFGPLFHKFVYWYADPIPILDKPETLADAPEDLEYFAMNVPRGHSVELPFEWQRIADFNMDRSQKAHPELVVVVGRRIRERRQLPSPTLRRQSQRQPAVP